MNMSELARRLNENINELRLILPEVGFDIGKKAIKVDDRVASRIIEQWPDLKAQWKREHAPKEGDDADAAMPSLKDAPKKVSIPSVITVRDLAAQLGLPPTTVIAELMKSGVLATLNERIDYDTAHIVSEDLGYEVERVEEEQGEADTTAEKMEKLLSEQQEDTLEARPPVVVIMGHVDHGKTKLLDYIRKSKVMEGEAGGITQHIGAYQATQQGRRITFIDTPGHEAFTAMRSRGARVADIAILIVAADDGIKPQTLEAIKIIQATKLPFVVAMNKVDKPEANVERVKQELAQQNLLPEDWGGTVVTVPVSAKTGEGTDQLLESILLLADAEKDRLMANPHRAAAGTVIESNLDQGFGPVATVLVQTGTLRTGDTVLVNGEPFGKVRAMQDFRGRMIDQAGPAMPARIVGFKVMPQVGDILEATSSDERVSKQLRRSRRRRSATGKTVTSAAERDGDESLKRFNLILKTDVLGSQEAILETLDKLGTDEVRARVISKGLGNVTDNDVLAAEASGAVIYAFNVQSTQSAMDLAREKEVEVLEYRVIFELTDDVRARLEDLLEPEIIRTELGRLKVLAIFKTEKDRMIVGGKVTKGFIEPNAVVEVRRDKELVGTGTSGEVQSGKQKVDRVEQNQEAGLEFIGPTRIQEGDVLEFVREEKVEKKLS